MGIVKRYEIRKVVDSTQLTLMLLGCVFVTPLIMVVTWILFSRIPYQNDQIIVIFALVQAVLIFGIIAYVVLQTRNTCIFEIYEDRLVQKYLERSFFRIPRDRVILFNQIEAYKSYLFIHSGISIFLYLKLRTPKIRKVNITVVKPLGDRYINFENGSKMIDDFIFCLEYYVEHHPDYYPIEKHLRFQEDNWGWIRLNRIKDRL